MVAGDRKMKVTRLAAKRRRDARATTKLESNSDIVTEKIIETPMGHVNNRPALRRRLTEEREKKTLRGTMRPLGGRGKEAIMGW